MNAGLRIITLAKEKGITQKYLESKINSYRGKITEWKNEKSTPTDNELYIIANCLETSTDYLLGKTDIKKPTPDNESGLSMPEERLITLFRQVPLDSQGLVVSMIETALKSQGLL